MQSLVRRYPLLTFVVLAYGLSWAYWIPLALRGARVVPGGSVSHFPGLLGPAIAAFLTTALLEGRQGLRELLRRLWLVPRPAARFWAYALSPLAFIGVALLVASLLSRMPATADFAVFSGLPRLPLAAVVLLVLLFNGYGEETGWRGFALPRLQERFGPVAGALVLALIWAGWHVPTFWTIEGYTSMTPMVMLFGFGLGICAGSLVLAQVFNRTNGSILAVSLWHLTYNLGAATAASRGLVGAVTTACVQVWAVIILVQAIRSRRARGPESQR